MRDVPVAELASIVITEIVRRTGLRSTDIDDVTFGQCYPNSEAPCIGRVAALDAGLDVSGRERNWTDAAGRASKRSSTLRCAFRPACRTLLSLAARIR
ncbi:hypothetical protein [Pacificispira sp.]|uniref:hypothetical protein n=1 Tax=Pacificispira sp. TaxID=2888761 RepID=UPI003B5172AC